MAVEASGSVSLAEDTVMDTLAALAAVQAFFGVASTEAARAKLFNDQAPDAAARPFGIVYLDPDGAGFLTEQDGFGVWNESGEVRVMFQREVPVAHAANVADAERDLKNHIGAIIGDLREISGGPGYANLIRIRSFGPWRFDEKWEEAALGKLHVCGLVLDWMS